MSGVSTLGVVGLRAGHGVGVVTQSKMVETEGCGREKSAGVGEGQSPGAAVSEGRDRQLV